MKLEALFVKHVGLMALESTDLRFCNELTQANAAGLSALNTWKVLKLCWLHALHFFLNLVALSVFEMPLSSS